MSKHRSSHRERLAPQSLDRATSLATAMDSFSELLTAVRKDGYVPTLFLPQSTSLPRRKAILMIRKALNKRGLRVYPSYGTLPSER